MTDLISIIILGIVQGITEFLPISSTGHLIVAAALLNFGQALEGTFEIFIQIGSVIAVIAYYRADILQQARTVRSDPQVQRFWLGILIAFIPAGAVGFLFNDWITEVLYSPTTVGITLIIGGIIFLLVERRPMPSPESLTAEATQITLRQALLVGIAQIVALIPGVSRSGATIVGGMLAGLSRKAAAQFAFYLAIPTLGSATIYSLIRALGSITGDQLAQLALGAVVSGIVSWLAIAWLLRFIQRNTFIPFGIYRIIAGIVILLLVAAGVFASPAAV